jgi:acyl-coenzyme A thioesterase PaaI-like protein
MSGINKHGKRLLKLLLRESTDRSFGKYTASTIKAVNYDSFPEKLSYRYTPPPAFCHEIQTKENKKELFFSTSGILAVMDELSTYAISLEDKNYRGGVSVDLFVETLKPVSGHEDVYLVTRTDKIGKVLAFCTMELTDLKGDILARGKHIKFLPLPFAFVMDSFAASPFFGVLLNVYETFREKKFRTPIDNVFGVFEQPGPLSTDITTPEHVFNLLNLTVNDDPSDRKALLEDAPDNHHCDDSELYNMKVKPELCNFIGNMHGGAVATAIEESSRLFKESKHKELQHLLKLKSVDVRYISPMKVRN